MNEKGFGMSAMFVPYGHVPLGFEMVIEKKEVKSWNLWWNIRLTDDPKAWDSEVDRINELQDSLGRLTENQRLIRAQMAEFCRLHPLFPQSIECLCAEIGDEYLSRPLKIGCEGRGLLESLGYHNPQSLGTQQQEIFVGYTRSLEKWLIRASPETSVDRKVHGFLGQPMREKEEFVRQLSREIACEEPSILRLKNLSENECRKTHGESAFDPCGHPLNCYKCPELTHTPPRCQCCYSMILDTALLCTHPDKKERIVNEFHRFIEENILAYAEALNLWLNGESWKLIPTVKDARYIPKEIGLSIAKRIHLSLGKKDKAKKWLTASLLKTIKGNQRWHRRNELIDDFPEATSWFREML